MVAIMNKLVNCLLFQLFRLSYIKLNMDYFRILVGVLEQAVLDVFKESGRGDFRRLWGPVAKRLVHSYMKTHKLCADFLEAEGWLE